MFGLKKKSQFDKDFDNLVENSKVKSSSSPNFFVKVEQILDSLPESFNLCDVEKVDDEFTRVISELKEYYQSIREILGKEISKNSGLVELNQMIYALEKNVALLRRDEFNVEEFLKFQSILISEIRKLG